MKLPYSVAREYCDQLGVISGNAVNELMAVVDMLPWTGDVADMEMSRDAVISYIDTLLNRYGNAAAAHAAETFEIYAEAFSGKAMKKAIDMAEVAPIEEVSQAVHFAAKSIFDGECDIDAFKSRISGQLTRYIHSAANRTMADAGATKYARILGASEHGSCQMCEGWAELGFVWPDDDMIEPHDGCQCSVVPGFGSNPQLIGKPEREVTGNPYPELDYLDF